MLAKHVDADLHVGCATMPPRRDGRYRLYQRHLPLVRRLQPPPGTDASELVSLEEPEARAYVLDITASTTSASYDFSPECQKDGIVIVAVTVIDAAAPSDQVAL